MSHHASLDHAIIRLHWWGCHNYSAPICTSRRWVRSSSDLMLICCLRTSPGRDVFRRDLLHVVFVLCLLICTKFYLISDLFPKVDSSCTADTFRWITYRTLRTTAIMHYDPVSNEKLRFNRSYTFLHRLYAVLISKTDTFSSSCFVTNVSTYFSHRSSVSEVNGNA